ncbi:AAA family ATPase [Fictibacillus sp. UD]|uniref:ATP-binding protein n=1 Tax=Fictibacillus sp. UD TaxID=3038777 RepID=UPI003744EE1A
MKIVSLHIYHFGGLRDCKISFEKHGLQMLYGENEAGKTTLMDFIKCMFYGFPSKNQSQRRYEPKNGNRMGGKMTIEHQNHGVWTIERIAGSTVSGDVSIYNETGQQKDELFLIQLLDNMEQSLFTGAFCFGLDGLQKLDKLTSEELGNFLLSTALSGDRDLLEIEQSFEKKQSALFKKSGKKPIINEKLDQLKSVGKTLESLKSKNESYLVIKNKLENLEKSLGKTKQELVGVQKDMRSVKRLFELKPVLERYKQLKTEWLSFDSTEIRFPENGIRKYEDWQKECSLLKGELTYIEDRLSAAEKEKKSLITNEKIVRYENKIKQMFNKLPQYEHLFNQLQDAERNIQSIEKEEKELFDAIGETWSETELNDLSLSLSSLHHLEGLIKQSGHLEDKKRRLEDELEDSRLKLERLEKEEAKQKTLLLSEEELAKYGRANNKQQANGFSLYSALLPLISAIVLIWSGWSSNALSVMLGGAIVFAAALILIFVYMKKYKTRGEISHQTHHRILEDEVNRKQWMQVSVQLSNENSSYVQLAKQLDYLEVEEASVLGRAEQWANQNRYKGTVDQLLVSGYMKRVLQLKELLKQKETVIQMMRELNEHLEEYEDEAADLSAELENEHSGDTKECIVLLQSSLEEQLKNRSRAEHLTKTCKQLIERKEELLKKLTFIENQMKNLWKEANVSKEIDFYTRAKENDRLIKLNEERDTLYNQLISLGFSPEEIDEMAQKVTVNYEDTVQLIENLEKNEEDIQREYSEKVEEKGRLDWELTKLLEDGSYSEHLHRYELLKEEWNSYVKKWASLRLAQHALSKVKENYQKTKLPAVLETSSVYFSKITESEYQSILFTEQNELMVVKGDGTRFYPHELSRGTAEQVYLAIRLAVASHAGPADFPILMDDIAVNFDEKRTRRTLQLIQEAAQERQILFFTCHKHVASIVPSVPLIRWPSQSVIAEM